MKLNEIYIILGKFTHAYLYYFNIFNIFCFLSKFYIVYFAYLNVSGQRCILVNSFYEILLLWFLVLMSKLFIVVS